MTPVLRCGYVGDGGHADAVDAESNGGDVDCTGLHNHSGDDSDRLGSNDQSTECLGDNDDESEN